MEALDINGNIPLLSDLSLEASAGTGKTYSLERIVGRLIRDEGISIESILVVTFTDKAAKEMKTRIRSLLKDWSLSEEDDRKKLRLSESVKAFDKSSIYTIHGFCSYILKTFTLETSSPFEFEVDNSDDIYREVILDYLSRLDEDLQDYKAFRELFSDFDGMVDGLTRFLQLKVGFEKGISLRPTLRDIETFDSLVEQIDQNQGSFFQTWNEVCKKSSILVEWAQDIKLKKNGVPFKTLQFIAKEMKALESFETLETLLLQKRTSDDKENLAKYLLLLCSQQREDTLSNWSIALGDITSDVEAVFLLIDKLEDGLTLLYSLYRGKVLSKYYRAVKFYSRHNQKLLKILRDKKALQGIYDYDDLIEKVFQVLLGQESAPLVNKLRKKYKVCLIDEFQDTDQRQWAIFDSIFSHQGHNKIIIGDPKQSIYGFRGADLDVYFRATKSVQKRFILDTNYRSYSRVIDGVNLLFQNIFDIHTGSGDPIPFLPVKKANSGHAYIEGKSQGVGILHISNEEDNPLTKEQLTKQIRLAICQEVISLLNHHKLIQGDVPRRISPGDIAILVETHSEGVLVQNQLTQLGVPSVVGGGQDLFQSQAALDLLDLLEGICQPSHMGSIKKALLTPFCGYNMGDIQEGLDSGGMEKIVSLFYDHQQNVQTKGLFSIFNLICSHFDYLKRQLAVVGGERHITDSQHIIEILMERQNKSLAPIEDLHRYLLGQIQKEKSENSVRLDQDQHATQIVTMHASKGLEYPIVFFHGGYKTGPASGDSHDYIIYNGEQGKVCDFCYDHEQKTFFNNEDWEERKRLYYVAFTRPVSRLYIPFVDNGSLNYLTNLWASQCWSDVRVFLKQIGFPSAMPLTTTLNTNNRIFTTNEYKTKKQYMKGLNSIITESIRELFITHSEVFEVITLDDLGPAEYRGHQKSEKRKGPRIFTASESIQRSRTWISSFSGLVSDYHNVSDVSDNYLEVITEVPDEPQGFGVLPKGPEFGDFVHHVLENTDFSSFSGYSSFEEFWSSPTGQEWCQQWCKVFHDMDDDLFVIFGQMIYNTLNFPLPNKQGDIFLSHLDTQDIKCEIEFLFKVEQQGSLILDDRWEVHKGYIKGFIDVLFIYKNQLYILDWKTNYLGNDVSYYDDAHVEDGMLHHHYNLQYYLYYSAIAQYLEWHPDVTFGGVYYLFLRGMEKQGYGIYHHELSLTELQAFDPKSVLGVKSHG